MNALGNIVSGHAETTALRLPQNTSLENGLLPAVFAKDSVVAEMQRAPTRQGLVLRVMEIQRSEARWRLGLWHKHLRGDQLVEILGCCSQPGRRH